MEKKEIEVINFIPCRLAEPISAVSINDEMMVFGSFTGYLGFIRIKNKMEEATYIEEIFD